MKHASIGLLEAAWIQYITVYTHILAERKTQNINAEMVGSAYMRMTIITL